MDDPLTWTVTDCWPPSVNQRQVHCYLPVEVSFLRKKCKHKHSDKKEMCYYLYYCIIFRQLLFLTPFVKGFFFPPFPTSFQSIFQHFIRCIYTNNVKTIIQEQDRVNSEKENEFVRNLRVLSSLARKESKLNFKWTITQYWVNVSRLCNKCYGYRN